MKEKTELKNVSVYIIEGISQKSGKPYTMLRIETGNIELDKSLKPIFLSSLQKAVLLKDLK